MVSSVAIILVNKILMQTYHFRYVFALTACHFLCNTLVFHLLCLLQWFESKTLPESTRMAAVMVISVVSMNLNLQTNSVGFYQLSKLLCVPTIVWIETRFYQGQFSTRVKGALVLTVCGVGIATVADVHLTSMGLCFALIAVLSTALQQVWTKHKQADAELSAIQFSHAIALPSFLLCSVAAVLVEFRDPEHVYDFMEMARQPEITAWIMCSCLLSVAVNLCTFGLIGKTSATTYQIVGHAKTCLVLLGGVLLFPESIPHERLVYNMLGVGLALIGVIWYGSVPKV